MTDLQQLLLPLGKPNPVIQGYDPSLLCAINRNQNRQSIGISDRLPFEGVDLWNAYELYWLEEKTQKPRIAMAEFFIPCRSENIVESKSFKLYLHSLTLACFKNEMEVKTALQNDLSAVVGTAVRVNLFLPPFKPTYQTREFEGFNLDDLPVSITQFNPEPEFLFTESLTVKESLCSNLLKTNCPITNQPDWASLQIQYEGAKINRAGLLKYIVSFRDHQDFHEHCVERIYMDIMQRCNPDKLTVYARYTRRGGLDINPFRSNYQSLSQNIRNFRQ